MSAAFDCGDFYRLPKRHPEPEVTHPQPLCLSEPTNRSKHEYDANMKRAGKCKWQHTHTHSDCVLFDRCESLLRFKHQEAKWRHSSVSFFARCFVASLVRQCSIHFRFSFFGKIYSSRFSIFKTKTHLAERYRIHEQRQFFSPYSYFIYRFIYFIYFLLLSFTFIYFIYRFHFLLLLQ